MANLIKPKLHLPGETSSKAAMGGAIYEHLVDPEHSDGFKAEQVGLRVRTDDGQHDDGDVITPDVLREVAEL